VILFVDESYQKDRSGIWHYALAGFGINEFRYRALQTATYKLMGQYFDVRGSYEGESWRAALGDRIVVEKSARDVELKSAFLLRQGNLRRFGGDQSPHYRLVKEILDAVAACRGTCLGVLTNPVDPQCVKDCQSGCPDAYTKLIGLAGRWAAQDHPGQCVTLGLDTEHNGVNLPLSRCIADYLYRSRAGERLRHVFPSPFWIDSQSMVGAQVADLVAHILMNSMLPESERKALDGLWKQVYGLRGRWDGGRGGTITRF